MRSSLLRYMEAHRIGVPTLAGAYCAMRQDRSQDLIPLKTLQRFLAGTTRTNDAFLIPCHQFASSLPDYGGPKEVTPDELARALGWFLNAAAQAPSSTGGAAARLKALAGPYEAFVQRDEAAEAARPGPRACQWRAKSPFPCLSPTSSLKVPAGSAPVTVREDCFQPGKTVSRSTAAR